MERESANSAESAKQKNACQYCQYCQFEGHKGRKNQETDKTDKANFYIPVKMEEEIFNLSKITKNDSKISKRRIIRKNRSIGTRKNYANYFLLCSVIMAVI